MTELHPSFLKRFSPKRLSPGLIAGLIAFALGIGASVIWNNLF